MKRKDFSLSKFRSSISMFTDRSYVCFDDKMHDLFIAAFCDLIFNSKDFDNETKQIFEKFKVNELESKDLEKFLRKKIWGIPGSLEQNQYANLLVILSCISDHWNIFPKEK